MTFTVTNLYDSGPGSLRNEVLYANAYGGTVNFAPSLAGSTLVLTGGEINIFNSVTIDGDINGDGTPDITISGNNASRIFEVTANNKSVTLSGLVLTNGYVGTDNGGALAVTGTGDNVTVRNSRLTNNTAGYVGTPSGGKGGAIALLGFDTLELVNTTIDHNHAENGGGGIYGNNLGTAEVINSTLSGNTTGASGVGGAFYGNSAELTLVNATVSGNSAYDGGAAEGSVTAYNSTVTGNLAHNTGGIAASNFPGLTLSNSIVAGNYGQLNDDVSGSRLVLYGNNILGSSPAFGSVDTTNGTYTPVNGRDLGSLQAVFASVGNDPNTGVLSGVLGDNEGPVQTVGITPGGLADNAGAGGALPPDTFDLNNNGNTGEPLPVDARDFARVVGASVDIGAVELGTYVVTTLVDNPYDGKPLAEELAEGNGLSLRQALGLANASGGPSTITFAPNLAGGTIHLLTGELDITSDVTIDGEINGNTPGIAIDAGYASRVFDVDNGVSAISATLDGLIIGRGYTGYTGIANNGGGILVGQSDTLALKNSTVVDNLGYAGGGIYGGQGSTISLTNTTLFANRSYQAGGGVYTNGTLTLTNATIAGNLSARDGGGISGGPSNNITLYNSTLTGNYAGGQGGGIFSNVGSSLTLANSIVAGNAAYGAGTDLYLSNSLLLLHGKSILGSTPATTGVIDTVNGTYTQINGADPAALATVFARVAQNPLTGVLSGVLADNGGPARTVAIAAGGLAYNAGSNTALPPDTSDLNNNGNTGEPLPVDARGFARVAGTSVDIGAFESQGPGTTFVVTTLADETYDGGTLAQETADGSGLSLREALGLANRDPTTADTIVFSPSLIGGSTQGVDDGTLLLTNGQLKVDGNVTIEGDVTGGGTPQITIDGQGNSRDLDITGGRVIVDGLTITGGYAYVHGGGVFLGTGAYAPANVTISNSVIAGNQAGYGGGIFVNYGNSLALTNSVVSGNSAYYVGGGIANQGVLQTRDVTVSGNTAGYIGGGIANQGTLVAIDTTISNNQLTNNGIGGGLYNSYGSATLVNSTISGNTGAAAGGGIYNSEGLQLTNVTIANNSATNGGGLYNAPCGCGNAAIYNSTFTGNYASQSGGGIDNANGTVTLTNTLVAGNGAGSQGADVLTEPGAITNYAGVNLFSQSGIGRPGIDITQPDLTQVFSTSALADNGGPVETVAILPGGSAQNTGSTIDLPPDSFDLNSNLDTAEPLPVDARGEPRVFGSGVDIGAVEAQGPVFTNVPASAAFTENAPPVELSPPFGNANALTVTDADATELTSATVTIAAGLLPTDVLAADGGSTGITPTYDPATGTLTLTGTDTLADYSQVLDSVTFSSPGANPDNFGTDPTRTLTWSAIDAKGGTGPGGTTTINITAINNPPALSNVASSATLRFPEPAITLSPAVSVSDPDDLTLAGATVQITGGKFAGDGDVLAATTAGTNISASFDPSSETLTLSGTDTLADYTQVLQSVTFDSTSGNPTHGGANPTRTVTWTANDGHGASNLSAPAVTTITLQQAAVPFDLNGDAVSDLIFQNNGAPQFWLWNGTSVTSQVIFPNPGANWHIITSRDVNGDGKADLIWQADNGQPGIWLMNGTTPTAAVGLTNPGVNWSVVGSGDTNGDGNADLLWQDTAGDLGVWEMNGTTPIAEVGIGNLGPNWRVVGAADFNADNRDDILLQNTVTGNLMIDLMNGTSIASSVSIAVGDPSWHAVSTGEFNGQAEIAWQNSNGSPGIWLMNGTTPVGKAGLASPGAGWQLVSVDHFTPGGQPDLLFQNTSGATMLWEMNGTSVATTLNLPNPGAGWQSVNGHPLASG
jgi:hypothetical protein